MASQQQFESEITKILSKLQPKVDNFTGNAQTGYSHLNVTINGKKIEFPFQDGAIARTKIHSF